MVRTRGIVGALGCLCLTLALLPASASARRTDAHAYRFGQVWSSAIRLLAVDFRFPMRDRDRDIGYLLFDYTHQGRSYPGSMELVPFEAGGQSQVRVTLNIPAMPAYIERMVLDRLKRKLREDHGSPLPPRPTELRRATDERDAEASRSDNSRSAEPRSDNSRSDEPRSDEPRSDEPHRDAAERERPPER